ncbi:hypothetical protein ACVFZR_07565 [Lacticaseibacillus paracasei]
MASTGTPLSHRSYRAWAADWLMVVASGQTHGGDTAAFGMASHSSRDAD